MWGRGGEEERTWRRRKFFPDGIFVVSGSHFKPQDVVSSRKGDLVREFLPVRRGGAKAK